MKVGAQRAAGTPPKTRPVFVPKSDQGYLYRLFDTQFRRRGFNYKQIVREGDVAIYEKTWSGCLDPSKSYEVVRIRRRGGFKIGGNFFEPAEVYPPSEAWGTDAFTFTTRGKAWSKFFEISALKEVQIEEALPKEKTAQIL